MKFIKLLTVVLMWLIVFAEWDASGDPIYAGALAVGAGLVTFALVLRFKHNVW